MSVQLANFKNAVAREFKSGHVQRVRNVYKAYNNLHLLDLTTNNYNYTWLLGKYGRMEYRWSTISFCWR